MRIFTITVAFCPASQLARCLIKARLHENPENHFIVMGHYPINREKNNRDIEMIGEAFKIPVIDPGKDLGSAQSQWWALQHIGAEEGDYWINLDPDSHCSTGWEIDAQRVLNFDEDCVVISCRAPLIDRFIKNRQVQLEEKDCGHAIKYGIARQPVPFNLSMWRYSFFKELGGIPQAGEMWGEVEGPTHALAARQGKYHAYLMNHCEDESGKLLQDKQLLEYKDLHMRTPVADRFYGLFREYLAWRYPYLLEMDTKIPDGTEFQ